MKSSFANRLACVVVSALLSGALAQPAAASVTDGVVCLQAYDIVCAESHAKAAGDSPAARRLRAEILFARAQFPEALAALEGVAPSFPEDEQIANLLDLYRATVKATEGFRTEKRGDVEIRYYPGTDVVLLDEAFEALQAAHDRIGPMLGGAPPGGVRERTAASRGADHRGGRALEVDAAPRHEPARARPGLFVEGHDRPRIHPLHRGLAHA
jgi:hypothetical protein